MLTFERWRHVADDHPELANARDAILAAVAAPVDRHAGHAAGEEWFYGHGFGPSRFVRVVVHFREGIGSITSAFPRKWFP